METPKVIFEDDYILALNKPAGWVVNDSETAHDNPTLQDFISKNFKFQISNSREFRGGIVHRLDKPTSGVILVAKTKEVFEALQKEFFDREVNKVYAALVHGKVMPEEGIINAPIARLPWKRINFGVIESGREAITNYLVSSYYRLGTEEFTLLELYPKTGRTHQLRVHLKHIGNPIVSDPLYAPRKIYKSDIKIWPRLWLHAKSIEFTHPVTKEKMTIVAPLPKDLILPLTK